MGAERFKDQIETVLARPVRPGQAGRKKTVGGLSGEQERMGMSEMMKWKPESGKRMGLRPHVVLFAIALALVPVSGHCDWLSSITELFGSKGKGMDTNIASGEASHIKVVREVALEIGRAPTPHAMAQTKDGGYVIAGTVWVPWATRVDANGNVVWRYELSAYNPSAPKEGNGHYNGAAVLQDDSAILCGEMALPPPPGKPSGGVAGMLTHLDKAGQVLNHQILYPNGDKSYVLSRLKKCVPWGDGVAVVGHVSRFPKQGGREDSFWLIALDGKGDIKWEKLISNPGDGVLTGGGTFKQIKVMSDGSLLLMASHPVNNAPSDKATRFDIEGNVVGEGIIPGSLTADRSTHPGSALYLFTQTLIPKFDTSISLWTLDGDLANAKKLTGKAEGIGTGVFYRLPDGSLFLVGSEYRGGNAAMAWISADLNRQETYIFKPVHNSAEIDNALPTGKPGEFVTARRVSHVSDQEKRPGVVLTFVQVK
ncbi:MAG: hypothetical protein FD134_1102 [Gallionellaceae bacterium]|nr:MAG: hypothetical protein FD134_1102 [Gallionellaceae bacterium]